MPSRFLELLEAGVALFDGAMGTMLYERGIFINRCFDEVNLSNADLVGRIHEEYVEAGADVIETNTFGANRFKLQLHGLGERLCEINEAGARIARKAARNAVLVAGSIGPLGIKIEPWGATSNDEAADAFREQAAALAAGGVDCYSLETFADLNEMHQAIRGVRSACDLPIVSQMSLQMDGLGMYGTEPAEIAQRLSGWGADVVGVNCSVGPKVMLEAAEKMVRAVENYVIAQPNAGVPQNIEGRNIYLVSPEYLAEYARRFVQVGIRAVGGCCGTTPAHIRAIRDALKTVRPAKTFPVGTVVPTEAQRDETVTVPAMEKSRLAGKLAAVEFVCIVELVPPKGCDAGAILESARYLAAAGVDAINIPDSPRATSRMSPLALALLIERETGIETVLHYCCRDRNILGMQSDLLGAHALGLRNILLVTGDPIRIGDYPDATAVFDIDSIGLTNVVHELNHGRDIGGRNLSKPTSFFIGVGVNPGAINFEEEMNRFHWKVDAGAEFTITQPVFNLDLFKRFVERIDSLRIPIIAGIWPLTSYRNAEFMNNELPGVHVPDTFMQRMREAGTGEEAMKEGVAIAIETLRELLPLINGVQISAPFNRYNLALDVFREATKGKRKE